MKNKIFNLYVNYICEYCGITREQLFSKTNRRIYSIPRFILYYVCSKRPMGSTEIASLAELNGLIVHRQNIDYGINRIEKNKDKEVWEIINSCIITFKNQ